MATTIIPQPVEPASDQLEQYAHAECVRRQRLDHRASVLIAPAGRCEAAVRFARLGAEVALGDRADLRQEIGGRILATGLADQIRFAAFDLVDPPADLPGEPYDIIFIRRGLCGLRYGDACRSVRQLLLKLRIGGKLFVTIRGLHSELGEGYADAERPVGERHARLAPAMVAKYGIDRPVCLYTERDLFMLLLEAGASVLRTMTTTYGSVQGVAVRV
ncbi:MAG: hypothetical protein FIB06_14310 [Betaproteobacteria bacterium]|nr:hypothetical protein [Betaproteobacteria bacterium]